MVSRSHKAIGSFYSVQFWPPQFEKDIDKLEHVPLFLPDKASFDSQDYIPKLLLSSKMLLESNLAILTIL